jgi:hypothetical protein
LRSVASRAATVSRDDDDDAFRIYDDAWARRDFER